jgi:hypothetical protein
LSHRPAAQAFAHLREGPYVGEDVHVRIVRQAANGLLDDAAQEFLDIDGLLGDR